MKFKSLTKLAMSGVALAAAATTLGASTYAWYVINPTATVTGVEASTAANGSTSILVSKDGSNFSGKIKFGADDWNGTGTGASATYKSYNKKPTAGFIPVRPKGATDLSEFYNATESVKTDKTAATEYMTFSVWVKAGASGAVTVKLSAVNNTNPMPTQYAYQSVTDSKTATQSFTVDAINALRTAVFVDDDDSNGPGAPVQADLEQVYETDKIAYTPAYDSGIRYTSTADVTDSTKLSGTTTIFNADGTTTTSASLSGAHLYYTQVMGELPPTTTDTATVTDATNISNVTLATANTPVKLTFVIWLEGGDDLCFDACGGQNFEFGLRFDAAQ